MKDYEYKGKPENWYNLANAIVSQAADDYICLSAKLIKREPNQGVTRIDCLNFFGSEWYEMLTNIDSKRLVAMMNEEVKKLKVTKFLVIKAGRKYRVINALDLTDACEKRFETKSEAESKAAELQGVSVRRYKMMLVRDNIRKVV